MPVCTFDYLPTVSGEAELRGECRKNENEIACTLTEVRAFPIFSVTELGALNSARMSYDLQYPKPKNDFDSLSRSERLQEWKKSFINKAEKNSPDFFAREKTIECEKEPRDYYQFRGAYNETYDTFLNKANVIHSKMCGAKAPIDFADAKIERWNLEKSTCELEYAEYKETFTLQKNGKWVSEDTPKGPERFAKCFQEMRTELQINGSSCSFTRVYKKNATKEENSIDITRKFTSRFISPLIKTCDYPEKKEAVFVAGPRKLPKPCEFVLDRERAAYCCAYNTK